MKTVKMISLLIVCAIVMSLAAVNSFAIGVIDTLTIEELSEPMIGWEPTYAYNTVGSGFDPITPGAGAIWYESEDGSTFTKMATNYTDPADKPVFKYGCYYRFLAEFKCDEHNVWEPTMKSVTINGKKADYTVKGDNNELITVTKDYGPLNYDNLVTFFSIEDVEEPVVGKAPSYAFTLKGDNVDYALPGAGAFWYESMDGGLTYLLLPTDNESVKFKDGGMYKFYTEVCATNGYEICGQMSVSLNNKSANVDTAVTGSDWTLKIAKVTYFFGPLGSDSMHILVVGDENAISTYYADTPTKASVIVMNTKENVDVKWYECNGFGEKLTGDPIGNDLTAFLPGIPGYDMMNSHYVLVVATETSGAKRSASLVIPYILYPMGFEEDPGEKINVTLKGGITNIVTNVPDSETYVEVEITNDVSSCSVDWFPCDDAGNIDWAHPLHNGYSFNLPGIDAKDAGKVFKYAVHAEDDRGGSYAGNLVFTYRLVTDAGNTGTDAESTPSGTGSEDSSAMPGETPSDQGGASTDLGALDPETPSGQSSHRSALTLPVILLIILGVVMFLMLCALCVLIGVLLGRRKNEKK